MYPPIITLHVLQNFLTKFSGYSSGFKGIPAATSGQSGYQSLSGGSGGYSSGSSGDYASGASIVSPHGGHDYSKGVSVVKGYGGRHTNIDLTHHGHPSNHGSFGGSFFSGKEIAHKGLSHGGSAGYGSAISSYDVGHGLGHYSAGSAEHGYPVVNPEHSEEKDFPPLGHGSGHSYH